MACTWIAESSPKVPVPTRVVGRHHFAELLGCASKRIERVDTVVPALEEAVAASGATPLHVVSHQFEPFGVTAAVLIAESHVAVHTWPELRYVAVDFFTCSEDMDAASAIRTLAERLGAERGVLRVVDRGTSG